LGITEYYRRHFRRRTGRRNGSHDDDRREGGIFPSHVGHCESW
jgi:hypothetical protein